MTYKSNQFNVPISANSLFASSATLRLSLWSKAHPRSDQIHRLAASPELQSGNAISDLELHRVAAITRFAFRRIKIYLTQLNES